MPRAPRLARPPIPLIAFLAMLVAPGVASAWTDAAVRSVSARVVVAPDATAHVTLTATVRVHGGWLEGLELAGLDPDLVLDETAPPYAIDESGARYRPRAEVRDGGRVQLAFRERSPRRGRLTVGITYRTSLAHRATEPLEESDHVRVRWTLPPWRSGLDGVEIEMIVPDGARLGPREDGDSASVDTEVEELEEGTRLRWRRAHLPRTLSWTVAADVPAGAMAEGLRGAPRVRSIPSPARRSTAASDPTPYWLGLALVVALLACAKIITAEALARRARARSRPLLWLPAWARALVGLASATGGGWLGPSSPRTALALFALAMLAATYRVAEPRRMSRLGSWRPADARWIRAARRTWITRGITPGCLFDVSTPLGMAHLAAWISLPWALPFPLEVRLALSVIALPILLTGTRASFPSGPMDTLAALLAVARKMRVLPDDVGLAPVVHVDVRGEVQDARVRTILARRPRGLLRLDFALSEAVRAGGYTRAPVLLVVTRAGSPAEVALTDALPSTPATTSPGGRRVLRLLAIGDDALASVVAALAACPEAPEASRGTASEQETVHELPAPRAVGF